MKNLILVSALSFIGLTASAQIKTTTTTNSDGTKSNGYSLELGKPTTTVNSEVNFQYPNGVSPEPIAYKKGSNNKTYILVANESRPDMSKYEIDIFAGNKKLSKATLLVFLSLTSPNKQQLSNGTYRYSDMSPAERKNYKFAGTVKLGDTDVDIVDGWVQVNSWDKRIVINYNLTLKNGVKTNGKYDTDYQNEDRSEHEAVNTGIKINQQ